MILYSDMCVQYVNSTYQKWGILKEAYYLEHFIYIGTGIKLCKIFTNYIKVEEEKFS